MTSIFRNACPRNCYSTCTILSSVENNRLIKVEGDVKNGYTRGSLCAKGYAYTQYVYSPYRIKYPLKQVPRNSGNWVRISWEEAYQTIATKILSLYKKNNSNHGIGYNKFSGNLGLLHYSVEAMFNSFGPHTKCIGNPCNLSGEKAVKDIFGEKIFIAPEKMSESDCIVIWGANPCVTNIHQMKFIFEAQDKGAKLIVIDPLYTETAKHADIYIQIEPSTDYLLEIGIIKWLVENKKIDLERLSNVIDGIDELFLYTSNYSFKDITKVTNVSMEAIELLARTYITSYNSATWIGFGIQRYKNGEQIVANICNMAAIIKTANASKGSIYYSNYTFNNFKNNLLNFPEKKHEIIESSREILINNFPSEALSLTDPKLKLLWIASRNPLSQDSNINLWKELIEQLELVVVVDLFMTKTTSFADIVLPATSQFEEEDLNYSYWNNWLTYNEKAIPNYYEAKSDLQIARELTQYLNKMEAGFSSFPSQLEPDDWIKKELTNEILASYNISSLEELKEGPKKYVSNSLPTSHRLKISIPPAETITENKNRKYTLLTPQSLLKIHSQYEVTSWLNEHQEEDIVEISSSISKIENLSQGEKVKIVNELGAVIAQVKVNEHLPPNVVLYSQAGKVPINQIISQEEEEQKKQSSYFYDIKVNLQKVGMNDVIETTRFYF